MARKLTFAEYKNKMMGCWMGKNIGGVLGAPFEGNRQVNQVDFYVQDLKGNPPPNDDLDLQLVWLNAVERYGRQVNASILGEYWLTFITPNWVEYGAGKNNLRMGLLPPISGYLENVYRNSCGCFIRSELWACLAPGNPELAVRYAYEDAIVDHSHDGMYGEVFCAAMQSAAFVENDKYKLLDIGLSYIPSDCGVARAVKEAIACYRQKVSFEQARVRVMSAVPGTFGVQFTKLSQIPTDVPQGEPGYDAPGNIGLMVVGWLYGEDDFGKSLCIANNCGEDTDCTCATLGALLGIIHGIDNIPKEWIEPIGHAISTCCINKLNGGVDIPETVDELTDRVLRLAPAFLGRELCDLLAGPEGYTIKVQEGDELYCVKGPQYIPDINGGGKMGKPSIEELVKLSPAAVYHSFPVFDVIIDYIDDPYIRPGQPKKVKLTVLDNGVMGDQNHQWITVKLYCSEGVCVSPATECSFFMKSTYLSRYEMEFEITAGSFGTGKLELIADISAQGRHSNAMVKILLIPQLG